MVIHVGQYSAIRASEDCREGGCAFVVCSQCGHDGLLRQGAVRPLGLRAAGHKFPRGCCLLLDSRGEVSNTCAQESLEAAPLLLVEGSSNRRDLQRWQMLASNHQNIHGQIVLIMNRCNTKETGKTQVVNLKLPTQSEKLQVYAQVTDFGIDTKRVAYNFRDRKSPPGSFCATACRKCRPSRYANNHNKQLSRSSSCADQGSPGISRRKRSWCSFSGQSLEPFLGSAKATDDGAHSSSLDFMVAARVWSWCRAMPADRGIP